MQVTFRNWDATGSKFRSTENDFGINESDSIQGRRRPITLFLGAMIILAGILVYFSTEENFALRFRQAG